MLVLAGCQTLLRTEAESTEQPSAELPFAVPVSGPKELDSDIVFSYLVGEIGAQRGDLTAAYGHYLHAAIIAHDAYAAERATRIALFRQDLPGALRATRRWVELAPNDTEARQHAIVMFLRDGQADEARSQADALLRIAGASDQDGFLQIAGVLSKEKDKASGLRLVRELSQQYPDDARTFFAQAVLEAGAEEVSAAETSLRRAIALDAKWEKPWILLSRVLAGQGRDAEARELLADGLRQRPQATALRTTYARLLVDAEQFYDAFRQFQILRKQSPEDDDILYAVGMLSMQAERWDDARDAWQTLRNLDKRHEEATYYLAQVEEATDNPAVAVGLYAAVNKGPLRPDAALRLAVLKGEMGQLREAREILQQVRVLDAARSVDAYLTEVRLFQEYGSQDDVLTTFETALRAHPGNSDLLYSRAIYAAEIQRVDWLERDLGVVLAGEPDNADALNALGYTLADQTDRFEEAFGYIQKAYKLKPDNPAVLDSMGWVYYRLGQLDLALDYLRRAHKKMQDPEIAAHLGEVLWISGDHEQARRVWNDAMASNPDDEKLRAVVDRFK